MIRNIFLLMLSALCAWSCTDNLPGDEAPTDDRHSLNITVGPKPAFTDGTLTRADGTPRPDPRRPDRRRHEVGRGGCGMAVCHISGYRG